MTIVVPKFPFAVEDVEIAHEFRDALFGIRDLLGDEMDAWGEELEDADFAASVAAHWAFLTGRAPEACARELIPQLLGVTDQQFHNRIQTGVSPF